MRLKLTRIIRLDFMSTRALISYNNLVIIAELAEHHG